MVALTDRGWALGAAADGTSLLWRVRRPDRPIRLDRLVSLPRGWTLASAVDMNERGQILASAVDQHGDERTTLLSPRS